MTPPHSPRDSPSGPLRHEAPDEAPDEYRDEDRAEDRDEDGYTLIEILTAIGIFLILMSIVMTTVISINRATTTAQQFTNMNEQARIATERLTREMRQAVDIREAVLPTTPGGDTSVTFGVDFNGDNIIEAAVPDPEIITYRYDATNQRLTLTANDQNGNTVTQPILSDQVTNFAFQFRSSLWQYDTNADGITTWEELDAAPGVGNQNGALDDPELSRIDIVAVTLTVMDGPHKQTYQTQVGLRNQSQN